MSFVSVIHLGIALDKDWYKVMLWHDCSMGLVLCMGVLCICTLFHEQMSKNGAFMKLQFILVIFILEWYKLYGGNIGGIH